MDWVITSTPKKVCSKQQQTNGSQHVFSPIDEFCLENTSSPGLSSNNYVTLRDSSPAKSPKQLDLTSYLVHDSSSCRTPNKPKHMLQSPLKMSSFQGREDEFRSPNTEFVFKPIHSPLHTHATVRNKVIEPKTVRRGLQSSIKTRELDLSDNINRITARKDNSLRTPLNSLLASPKLKQRKSFDLQTENYDGRQEASNNRKNRKAYNDTTQRSRSSHRIETLQKSKESELHDTTCGHLHSSHHFDFKPETSGTKLSSTPLKSKNSSDYALGRLNTSQKTETFQSDPELLFHTTSPRKNVTFQSSHQGDMTLTCSRDKVANPQFGTRHTCIRHVAKSSSSISSDQSDVELQNIINNSSLINDRKEENKTKPTTNRSHFQREVTDFSKFNQSLPVRISNFPSNGQLKPCVTSDHLSKSLDRFTAKNSTNKRDKITTKKENKSIVSHRGLQCPLHGLERSLRLINLLYHTDTDTRNNTIILARWFQQWHGNVNRIKSARQREAHLANIAYDFFRSRVLKRYFHTWSILYKKTTDDSQACSLHRYHLLRKALKALTWAVSEGHQQKQVLLYRYETVRIKQAFFKWRERWERKDTIRRQIEVDAWKRKNSLMKKCVQFRKCCYQAKVKGVFKVWKTVCINSQNTRLAHNHYRQRLVRSAFHNWCVFTAGVKVTRLQKSLAQVTRDRQLKTRWFYRWCSVFYHNKQIRHNNRRRLLGRHWRHWKSRLPVHRANTQRWTSIAVQFQRHALLSKSLEYWNAALIARKASSVHRLKTLQKTWLIWKGKVKKNVKDRSEVERSLKRNVMLKLKIHAEISKQCCQAGFRTLQTSLIRRAFNGWLTYRRNKSSERTSIETCEILSQKVCLTISFNIWVKSLAVRHWERFAVKVRLETLTRRAFNVWRVQMKEKPITELEKRFSTCANQRRVKRSFNKWHNRYCMLKKEAVCQSIRNLDPNTEMKRNALVRWRVFTQQSIVIRPLTRKVRRRQLFSVFDGWRRVIIRDQLYRVYREYCSARRVVKLFLWWRIKYLTSIQTKECGKISQISAKKLYFRRWRQSIRLRRLSTEFHGQCIVQKYFLCWRRRYRSREQETIYTKQMQRSLLLIKYLHKLRRYTTQKKKSTELSNRAKLHYRYQLLKKSLKLWKFYYQARISFKSPSCGNRRLSFDGEFPLLCVGERLWKILESRRLRLMWRNWVTQYVQSKAIKAFRAHKLCTRYFKVWYCNTVKQTQSCLLLADSVYHHNKLRQCFNIWHQSSVHEQELNCKLQEHLHRQHSRVSQRFWISWRTSFQLRQATKQHQLLVTWRFFTAWKSWANDRRDKGLRVRAFHRAVQERTLRTSYSRWKHCLVAVKLQVSYQDARLMAGAYGSWERLSEHIMMIDRLCDVFITTRNQSIVWKAFMLWKDCVRWNTILDETGDVLEHQRNSQLKKIYMNKWKLKFLKHSADREYSSDMMKKSFGVWKSWMDTPL